MAIDLIPDLTPYNKSFGSHLVLKNRFGIKVEKSENSFFSDLNNSSDILNSVTSDIVDALNPFGNVKIDGFNWDSYVEAISNTVTGTVFNPVKLGDVYERVKSFEENYQITITFVILDASIVQAVLSWINKIYNRGFGYYDDYALYDLKISLKSLDTVQDFDEIVLQNCYPVSYKFSEFNHQRSQVVRLYVDFVFNNFKLGASNISEIIEDLAEDLF